MNPNNHRSSTSATTAPGNRARFLAATLLLCVAGGVLGAMAQDTNTPAIPDYSKIVGDTQLTATNAPLALPPIDYTENVPAPPPSGTSQLAEAPPMTGAPLAPLLQYGPVQFQPHLYYRLSYGDGIQARPGESSKTWINELAPGILFRLGQHWTLDYTPSLYYYSSSKFRDTWNNAVTFSGGTSYNDWSFGLVQSYTSSSQPLAETLSQTDQETYNTGLSAVYHMSTPMSLELGLSQSFRYIGQSTSQQLSDSRSWSTMDWLNYQFNPRFAAAVGVGFGYDNLAASPDMTHEQVQGRVTWKATDKLDVTANAGFEDRQFLNSNTSDSLNPIFGLTAGYALFETTTLSLTASRTVSPSFYSGQISESTSVSLGLSQRLLGKLTLSLSGGYGNSAYQATTTGPAAASVSSYDRTFFSARLGAPFLKRGNASIFYQVSSSTSGSSNYDYSSTQVGLELSYRL